MKNILMLTCILMLSFTVEAKKKESFVDLRKVPFTHLRAIAIKNHLKRVETVGGFLRWAEKGLPKKEMLAVRKWVQKMEIPEDAYFPQFQVKDNVIFHGRDRLEIHDNYVVLNKKRYNFRNEKTPPAEFLEELCRDAKCGKQKSANLDRLVFPEAQALAWWAWFGLGFATHWVVTKWGWPWQWFRKRGVVVEEYVDHVFAGEEVRVASQHSAVQASCTSHGVTLVTKDGRPIEAFDRQGDKIALPSNIIEDGLSCKQQAQMINQAVKVNKDEGIDGPLDGFTTVSGTKGKDRRGVSEVKKDKKTPDRSPDKQK